jgi:PleD family two-component response regulator
VILLRSGTEIRAETAGIRAEPRGMNPELETVSDGDGLAMMTNATTTDSLRQAAATSVAQKVVIVNGSSEMLDLLETVLDAGHYDVVFVESSQHAYSQIKRVQPNLVVLCVRIDDADGFHVLSMLKLDEETRQIPVLTYTEEYDGQEPEEEVTEFSGNEIFSPKAAVWMN